MKITINRTDGLNIEMTTPENATIQDMMEFLTIALQNEGYTYVTSLDYTSDAAQVGIFDHTDFNKNSFNQSYNLDITTEAKNILKK